MKDIAAPKAKAPSRTQKEPIKLREKELANGNVSLYLDVYFNGKRKYEFLKLYLNKAKTPLEKEQNKNTLQLAQSIKAKRQVEIQNGEYGFNDLFKLDTHFLEYFSKLCEDRQKKDTNGNVGNWNSCLRHLERYCKAETTFRDVDAKFIEGFKDYLDNAAKDAYKRKHKDVAEGKPLSQNTKLSYFNKLRACVNEAFEDSILPVNPFRGIEGFKQDDTERTYLTVAEIKKLVQAECKYPALKKAFLFGCLTGLRKSDIEKMVWGEVQQFGERTRIVFKQKKTGGQEYLDINPQAKVFMGESRDSKQRVFVGFKYNSQTLLELTRWCLKAGITKDVTFHSSRHSFAVMMLDLGTDIYTVSKLLGHKDIKTTQIYANILDPKKQDAVDMIPDINIPDLYL